MPTLKEAIDAFQAADDAWSYALPNVANARYKPIGRGEPGTPLRALYEARDAARLIFNAAWDVEHARCRAERIAALT